MTHGEAHRVIQLSLALICMSTAPAAGRCLFPGLSWRAALCGGARPELSLSRYWWLGPTHSSPPPAASLYSDFFSFQPLLSHSQPPICLSSPFSLHTASLTIVTFKAESDEDFSQVISAPDKYEHLGRHSGWDAAVNWMWETAPHPGLDYISEKVNPSIPSMPSKSASLLTLGNLSQTHMNCLLCLTCFLSIKQRGLPPVSFWSLSSFFFFFFFWASILHYK